MPSVPRSFNHLLQALPPAEFEALRPHLQPGELVREAVLVEAGAPLTHIYLPESGIISMRITLSEGQAVEVAMVGRDGVFGASAGFTNSVSLTDAVVLLPGTASILEVAHLRAAADRSVTFRTLLARHEQALFVQAQQSAACNASHSVEARLSRWLLHTRDLTNHESLPLTQEVLAQMIGVQRNAVSIVANALQKAGILRYSRGHIEIARAEGLRETSCECYQAVKAQHDRLLKAPALQSPPDRGFGPHPHKKPSRQQPYRWRERGQMLLANSICEAYAVCRKPRIGGGDPQDRLLPSGQEALLDSAPRSPNGFLSALAADDFELVRPYLRTVDLHQESVLVEVDEALKRAYLPHRGVISLVVKLAKGESVQIAMIGRDSILGSFSALGDPTALNSAVVLVPGVASTLDVDRLRSAADQSATFRATLVRHGLAVYAQIQQTAGCNAAHPVESRLARCLLHTRDLSGSNKLVLTQESMAQMIGARRNSVSLVANTLQQANFIHYSRGHIEITDLDGLGKTSCECYATVKAQYERLIHPGCRREH